MKTRALLLALPLVALAGCRDNRASLQVQMICVPTDDCTFKDTCELQFIGFPIVDSNGPGRLSLFLQVENQLPGNENLPVGRLNTNDAHLDEVVVEYEGVPLPKDSYVLANQRVGAGGTAVVFVEAIRPVGSNVAILRANVPATGFRDLVAKLRLRGYYDDGSRFETGEFPVTIRLCRGCIPSCAPGDIACPAANSANLGSPGMEPFACGTTT